MGVVVGAMGKMDRFFLATLLPVVFLLVSPLVTFKIGNNVDLEEKN